MALAVQGKKFYCLYEFDDDSVEIGPVDWIKDVGTDVNLDWMKEPHELVNEEVMVIWGSGKGTSTHHAKVLAVSDSKEKLITKRNKLCNDQPMDTDIETGRGKRKKKPVKFNYDESEEEEEEPSCPAPTKKVKSSSKLGHCNELAKQLKRQMFGTNEAVHVHQTKSSASTTVSRELDQMKEEVEKLKKEKEVLQGKLIKEKASRENLQQQLLFLKGVPKFIDTFNGFMSKMEDFSRTVKHNNIRGYNGSNDQVKMASPLDEESSTVASPSPSSSPSTSSSKKPSNSQTHIYLTPTVTISKSLLQNCNSSDYRKYTCDLMLGMFGRKALVNSSLTGGKNSAGQAKPPLDSEKVQAITSHVMSKFGRSVVDVRTVMRNKVSNEVKLAKKRAALEAKKTDPGKESESNPKESDNVLDTDESDLDD
ncbi:uncharacterized protein LOC121431403 [Lytechinus variegatus]|uniref:uncharacterized protein LOC121431403 n=1 Tax=Lytechinus variegatus TaxID=7654 RepID=UPI001BB245E3|nr:uncharacterized protein LOC121431403 [Lytechinus variegatus]